MISIIEAKYNNDKSLLEERSSAMKHEEKWTYVEMYTCPNCRGTGRDTWNNRSCRWCAGVGEIDQDTYDELLVSRENALLEKVDRQVKEAQERNVAQRYVQDHGYEI